jgi:hypothetical protein
MNDIKVKRTAHRIKAFGREYTVYGECVSGFVVHDLHPAGHLAEVIILRKHAEILIGA